MSGVTYDKDIYDAGNDAESYNTSVSDGTTPGGPQRGGNLLGKKMGISQHFEESAKVELLFILFGYTWVYANLRGLC
jgi:hypothetical protein